MSVSLPSGCLRAASRAANDKEPLKKAKTPKGRFDNLEETSKDVLESEKETKHFLHLVNKQLQTALNKLTTKVISEQTVNNTVNNQG